MTERYEEPSDHDVLLALAHRAADAAATITLAAFRKPLRVEDKAVQGAAFDPVTEADRRAEQAIREVLASGAPGIPFTGEESTASAMMAGAAPPDNATELCRWIVDPIDGTRAFIAGIPLWGTLIALRCGERVPFGLLDQPALRERFVGTRDRTLSIRPEGTTRLQTRSGTQLADALMCCTTPEMFVEADARESFARLAARVRTVRYGTDCHGYAMLAAGHVDLVVEADLAPWDVQALIPIVRGAGGSISDWLGGDPGNGGRIVAAAHPALHAAALAQLQRLS